MKKFCFFVLLLMGILTTAMAQGLQVSFECQYQNGNSLLLDSVQIKNQTRNWMMTVYYPNLTISLGDATNGITEVEFDNEGLARTIPNPFNGHTHAQLSLLNNEYIIMRVFDVAGKNVAYYEGQLTAGEHDFDLVLSTPQTYILQVKTTRKTYAIKMVNTGNGGEDKISLKASNNEVVPKSAKQIMDYDFEVGDLMYYQGFVTIDNEIVATEAITQNQYVSELITFTIHTTLPTVTTNMVSNITEISAICGGNVISTGGSSITARGVCWSTSQNPTINDNHTSDGSGTGSFNSNITGLIPATTYYVRAYAINSVGTAYGNQLHFTTPSCDAQPCPGATTVTDIDNNTYNTVQIGAQCWMKENLRTTRYSNGTSIALGSSTSTTTAYRYYPNNDQSNVSTYGYLYNWKAVMGSSSSSSTNPSEVHGICPTGWHVPSDAEWKQLTNYVSSQSQYQCNGSSEKIAKALASITGWSSSSNTCAVGNDPSSNNATGFSALPAGDYGAGYSFFGDVGYFWSATEYYDDYAYHHYLFYNRAVVSRNYIPKYYGFSVRCVRDESESSTTQLPTVTTTAVNNVTANTATCGGNVTSDGGGTVTARGVCWSTSQNPTISDNHTSDGSGTGSFISNITDLTAGTTYYVRAYATNSAGIAYGEQRSYTTSTPQLPTVTTTAVNNVTATTATCGGNVTSDGGGTVTVRGVCWSISQNPTVSGNHTSDGSGTGSFTSNITGLTPVTTYYVRAYAINSAGTTYGEQRSFTTSTPQIPTVTTIAVNNVTATTATCGGNVTSDGGATVIARGVCWSTSQNPTVSDNHTSDGTGTGGFTSNITGLTPATTYYVRAYVINSVGTAYGDQLHFMTSGAYDAQPCPGAATVTDIDNNTYNTVQIGNQCWMKENLRTTRYANGTSIPLRSSTNNSSIYSTWAYLYYPNNNYSYTVSTYGYMYNWKAVMGNASSSSTNPSGVQGICPTGWHVPSDAEWIQLENYVSSQSEYLCDSDNTYIAKALASTTEWNSGSNTCAVNNNPSANNATGFSALPAGCYNRNFGNAAYFWSATEYEDHSVYYRLLSGGYAYVYRDDYGTSNMFSVRCVRDINIFTVTTDTVGGITATTATCGGNVTATGGANIIARGVCWSTSQNPTVNDSHTTDGSETGSFTSSITGLTPETIYYVRAYATNNQGTAYGEVLSLTTMLAPCPGTPTVTDIDNNTYNTVRIGTQCWMKENLRTTRYANGSSIPMGSTTSTTSGYRYYPCNDQSNVPTYGYLYNWKAVMGNSSSSSSNPSGVQGICPTGWHIPSDAEWTQMTNYMSSQSQYVCGADNTYIAKALASTTGWNNSSNTCAVGNNPSANNATGFSVLPAGKYYYGSSYCGGGAVFWSATAYSSNISYAYYRALGYSSADIGRDRTSTCMGYSVRCVRDESGNTTILPTLNTNSISSITVNTATCGGNVTYNGGATVTARGVCWSTSHNPTISGKHTTNGSGTGSFTSNLTRLIAGTTYYVRAYATNSQGTTYGNEMSFTTMAIGNDGFPCPGTPTVTDIDSNTYNTVQIGTQCWIKENLRTTRYSNGTSIALGNDWSTTTAYRYYPGNNSYYVSTYGYLYNWKAVMGNSPSSSANPSGVQGICPTGWHIPSDAEWTQLTDYVSSQRLYVCGSNNNTNIAKALAYTTGWNSLSETCVVGNNPSSNNATGFSALPAGNYGNYGGNFGYDAYFWSATDDDDDIAYHRNISYNIGVVGRNNYLNNANGSAGFSVRCIRDEACSLSNLPMVTTNTISNITSSTATCVGNVTSTGGATVSVRGVCWSTSQNPTVNDCHTTDGSGMGCFTSNLTGLTPGMVYYVRAYATNSAGTAYGNLMYFSVTGTHDTQPCPEMETLTDIDNNVYNTVQIGSQCWTRENLRTTRYSNGTSIALGSGTSTTMAYRYYPNNDQSNVYTYGYLYNWKAVMGNSSSSSANPSGGQGICPTGWHVPSDAEWTQLTNYVSSQSQYVCSYNDNEYNIYIAKALASTTGWNNSIENCAVGNIPSFNNATGFSVLPAGYYNVSFGTATSFWSATENYHVNSAYCRSLSYHAAYVNRYYTSVDKVCSVRCIHDEGGSTSNLPTVTTNTVSNITTTTAICGGNVTSDGGATVTSRGVCWSTSQNPTISDSHTTDGNGTGNFTSNITGLQPSTTYYVRAYAINSVGTAYGEQRSFTTDFIGLPTVTTNTVNNITTSTATCGGSVTFDGGATVTSRGVCWSTSQNPTISDSHTTDGNGTGNFTSNITGLQPNTTYYVRAYATNSAGTAYGSQVVFTTTNSGTEPCYLLNEDFDNGTIPTGWTIIDNDADGYEWNHSSSISTSILGHNESSGCMMSASYVNNVGALTPDNWLITPAITIPSNISASLSFWLCAQDSAYASEHYGVYITTSSDYTNVNNYSLLFQETIDASGGPRTQGTWRKKTAVLQGYAGQSVHIAFRHFNCTDMYYLNIDDVTVQYDCSGGTSGTDGQPCPGAATVTDIDNNTYNTVQIGNQCWMKENLRTTRYFNGSSIALGSSTSTTTAYRYYPNNDQSNVSTYGYLYNWKAVMGSSSSSSANPSGAQGICPTGWHVPSDAEWTQLTDYVGSQNQYVCGSNSTCIAKALASTTGWNSSTSTCAVGNTPTSNNATGFSALPAGGHYDFYGSFGEGTYFWSATEYNVIDANCPNLFYYYGGVYRSITNKGNGFSVRCVRD